MIKGNVLITGGLGYIGSHCVIELMNQGYRVIIYDDLSNSDSARLNILRGFSSYPITFIEGDVRDIASLKIVMKSHDVNCVIHAAGVKSVPESILDPKKYWDVNVFGSLQVISAMVSVGVKNLIFSSSATIYSLTNKMPVSEESLIGDCISPYGWSKFAAEALFSQCVKASGDINCVFLRYFNPVGADPSGLIRECKAGVGTNFFPAILDSIEGVKDKLLVFGTDYQTIDGTCLRDFIHVSDLATGHVAAIEYMNEKSGICEAFNLGRGQGLSLLQILKKFEQHLNTRLPIEFASRREGDLPVCYADTKKANTILGWHSRYDLDKMVADSLRSIGVS
jgi:UDP-glucose 4-epimerase